MVGGTTENDLLIPGLSLRVAGVIITVLTTGLSVLETSMLGWAI